MKRCSVPITGEESSTPREFNREKGRPIILRDTPAAARTKPRFQAADPVTAIKAERRAAGDTLRQNTTLSAGQVGPIEALVAGKTVTEARRLSRRRFGAPAAGATLKSPLPPGEGQGEGA